MSVPVRKPVPSRSPKIAERSESSLKPSSSSNELKHTRPQYETFDTAAFQRIMTMRDAASTSESIASGSHSAGGPTHETDATASRIPQVESAALERRNPASSVETSSIRETTAWPADPPHYDDITRGESSRNDGLEVVQSKKDNTIPRPDSLDQEGQMDTTETFERELLAAQRQEARLHLSRGDYAAAERAINDVLENSTLPAAEAPFWAFRRVLALEMLGRWEESLLLIRIWEDSSWDESGKAKTTGCMRQYEAEALLQIGETNAARSACVRALRCLEKEKDDPTANRSHEHFSDPLLYDLGDPTTSFNTCMELMTRIAVALDKPLEVQFYKSRLVDGYVSEPAMAQRRREQVSFERAAMLRQYHIVYHHDFQNRENPISISGEDGRDYEMDLMDAFEEAMRTNNDTLADLLLEDEHILSRKGRVAQNSMLKGRTALFFAIAYGNARVVTELIRRGADVNTLVVDPDPMKTWDNDDPLEALSLASRYGQMRIAEILLENRANIDGTQYIPKNSIYWRKPDQRKTTPLHEAIRHNTVQMARFLVEFGANVNLWDGKQMAPLHIASQKGLDEIVLLLLERGANIEQKGFTGRTALHYAVESASVSTVRLLLLKGASPYAETVHGTTPWGSLKAIKFGSPARGEIKVILKDAKKNGGGTWFQRKTFLDI